MTATGADTWAPRDWISQGDGLVCGTGAYADVLYRQYQSTVSRVRQCAHGCEVMPMRNGVRQDQCRRASGKKSVIIQAGHVNIGSNCRGTKLSNEKGATNESQWTQEVGQCVSDSLISRGFDARLVDANFNCDPAATQHYDAAVALHYQGHENAILNRLRAGYFTGTVEPGFDSAADASESLRGAIDDMYATVGIPPSLNFDLSTIRSFYMKNNDLLDHHDRCGFVLAPSTPFAVLEAGIGDPDGADYDKIWNEKPQICEAIAQGVENFLSGVSDSPTPPRPVPGPNEAVNNIPRLRHHNTLQWPTNAYCVSVHDSQQKQTHDGSLVALRECGSDGALAPAEQTWSFDNLSRSISHETHGLLDVPNWGGLGSQLHVWGPTDTDAQRWVLANGRLVSGLDNELNTIACLDVAFGDVNAGSKLVFWSCNDSPSQRWWLMGDGTIRPSQRWDLCVDLTNSDHTNGNQLQLWNCSGVDVQRWKLDAFGLSNATGGCIDRNVTNGTGPGAPAQIWACNAQQQQYFWYLGQVRSNGGFCMDARDANTGADVPVQAWECLGPDAANQQFYYFP